MILREACLDDASAIARVHVNTWLFTYRGIVPEEYLANKLSYEQRECSWVQMLSIAAENNHFIYVVEGGVLDALAPAMFRTQILKFEAAISKLTTQDFSLKTQNFSFITQFVRSIKAVSSGYSAKSLHHIEQVLLETKVLI